MAIAAERGREVIGHEEQDVWLRRSGGFECQEAERTHERERDGSEGLHALEVYQGGRRMNMDLSTFARVPRDMSLCRARTSASLTTEKDALK
jgi:hypothetical protein